MMISHGSDLFITMQLPYVTWGRWPQTLAHIKTGDVCLSVRTKRPFIGRVIYGYEANAQQFSGCCAKSFATQADALRFVEECRNRKVLARYRPETPYESCLFADSDGSYKKYGSASQWVPRESRHRICQ